MNEYQKRINSTAMIIVTLLISAITLLNNSVVTPILANIGADYPNISDVMLQQVVTIPALTIILTIFLLPKLNTRFSHKQIIIAGLIIFIISSMSLSLSLPFGLFILMRLFFGIGVGLINSYPNTLSVLYFTDDTQTKMMGFTNVFRVFGGIIATLLAGYLALFNWHIAFYIYGLAIFPLIAVIIFMDNEKTNTENKVAVKFSELNINVKYLLFIQCFYLLVNFIFVTNLALYLDQQNIANPANTSFLLVTFNIGSMLFSMLFYKIYKRLSYKMYILSYGAMTLSFLTFLLSSSFNPLLLASGLFGIAGGTIPPLIVREITNNVENEIQIVKAFTGVGIATFIGQLLSPFVAQLFKDIFNLDGAQGSFTIGLGLTFVLFFCTYYYFNHLMKK